MAKRNPNAVPKRKITNGMPTNARELEFCRRYIEHFDVRRAYEEAGYSNRHRPDINANKLVERFAEYLRPLREAKARAVAQRLALDQEGILRAMARKAVFDPGEFIEVASKPITTTKKGKDGKEEIVVREWDGKPVYATRMKPFAELTAEQRLSVEIIGDSGGEVRYRLPTTQQQHTYLTSIGRQMGLFHEKLIMERHFHRHKHAHLHLDDVPTARLNQLTQELLPYVGIEYAQQLGYTQDEIDEARRKADPVAEQG